MSGSPLVLRAVVALAAFCMFYAPVRANEAAHKMAEKFSGTTGGEAKKSTASKEEAQKAPAGKTPETKNTEFGKSEAERKAEVEKRAAQRKAAAARRAAEAKRRAAAKAAEDARRAAEHRRSDEADMLARARREAEEMRTSQAQEQLAEVERVIAAYQDRVAGFIIEPLVQGAAGILVHPLGYLRHVRELTAAHGIPLIADEVAVGFGRTGTMFACEQEQVAPDIICLAKGITGGYLPLAATLTSDAIHNAFLGSFTQQHAFYHGHTFSGNPLACAVARASLAKL